MFVVNVVSGKGGTGKTLISALLSELLSKKGYSVAVVDLDIFVRGVTALLYFGQKENLNLRRTGLSSVADLIMDKEIRSHSHSSNSTEDVPLPSDRQIAVLEYRKFHVCPAVARIDEILNHDDIMPDTYKSAKNAVDGVIEGIRQKGPFDVIILDSRAGFDEMIAASHSASDCSLLVEEDDQISSITAANLMQQLQNVKANSQVYRVINKWRGSTYSDTRHLGNVPFDADVVSSYGDDNFFDEIVKSTFEPAIVDIWNKLCEREGQKFFLSSNRVSPLPSKRIEDRTLSFHAKERFFIVYGLMLAVVGLVMSIGGRDTVTRLIEDPFSAIGFMSTVMGVVVVVFALARR